MDDLWELIRHHASAMTIQRRFMTHMYRHTLCAQWTQLRHALVKVLSFTDFDRLTQCAAIRREWRVEPESWLYSLKHTTQIDDIVREVRRGLWC